MKNLVLTFTFFMLVTCSYAQKNVAVLSGTTWTFYDDFSPALRAAPAGSTIYLPGGTFDLVGSDTINKQLTIIGAGFSLDSANATGITQLLGVLLLDDGADYTTIEGISLGSGSVGSLSFGSNYSNILIRRCYLNTIDFRAYTAIAGKNYYVSESVIGGFYGGSDPYNGIVNYNNLTVEKSIINTNLTGCYGATLNNNIILTYPGPASTYNNACTFSNNIFVDSSNTYEVATNSVFYNNIFRTSNTGSGGTNIYIGCVWNKSPNNIFINPPLFDGAINTIYNPALNFHLKSTSPAKNFGRDGTDAGIYGTTKPCKEGWVPFNPHISFKSIPSESLPNGTLPVNVKVVAQDR